MLGIALLLPGLTFPLPHGNLPQMAISFGRLGDSALGGVIDSKWDWEGNGQDHHLVRGGIFEVKGVGDCQVGSHKGRARAKAGGYTGRMSMMHVNVLATWTETNSIWRNHRSLQWFPAGTRV
jgi:hypothetical protein